MLVVTKRPAHDHRVLICDRDAKWSASARERFGEAGIRVVQTPFQAPNCNAYAERFVRSIEEECLNQVIVLGDAHLRRTLTAFVAHYQGTESPAASTIGSSRPIVSLYRVSSVPSRAARLGGLATSGREARVEAPIASVAT